MYQLRFNISHRVFNNKVQFARALIIKSNHFNFSSIFNKIVYFFYLLYLFQLLYSTIKTLLMLIHFISWIISHLLNLLMSLVLVSNNLLYNPLNQT